ncbi:MAG: VCBS repeat-containing protein [Pirellulales bacterium]
MKLIVPSFAMLMLAMWQATYSSGEESYQLELSVTSQLPSGNVPFDPTIDFTAILKAAELPGSLNPNSIEVINRTTDQRVPHARNEDFAYGDRGRLEWVIPNPNQKKYAIRFRLTDQRLPLIPQEYTPLIGVGDLLRYNAGQPRPISLPDLVRLIDLTGDGVRDLVGCWNYAYRPGQSWDGIFCYPRIGGEGTTQFGDPIRLRHVEQVESTDFKHFSKIYMTADLADFNGDRLPDLVYCPSGSDQLYFYLNSGRRDAGGMPIFVDSGSLPRQTHAWQPCRAVDLNRDGAIDFVVGDQYLENTNSKGWPITLAQGVPLHTGTDVCFLDLDHDQRLDAISLEEVPGEGISNYRIVWRHNLGDEPLRFGPPELLDEMKIAHPRALAAVVDGPRPGLLVAYRHFEKGSFFQLCNTSNGLPHFEQGLPLESISAVACWSDQAWPCICDWDGDGDVDLLVGGGYGWPRIVINENTHSIRGRMALAEPQVILSQGQPIRLTRDQILGGKHWHNMGYSYPVYVDWDTDNRPDLLLPNETNRIFWYQNIGTRQLPRFGPQQQVLCDGYPDSPELRALSARRASDQKSNNGCYPYEQERPFLWRTGAAFADWNGDGLMDFITHDGSTRKATLFVQTRDAQGKLRLKKDHPVRLVDDRPIDDSIVGRNAHWTESFRAADWNADGLIDLIYSLAGSHSGMLENGSIYLLRNIGTKSVPKFALPRTLCCYGKPIVVSNHGPHPWIGDLDGDGKPDILTCVEWSVYPFYSHQAVEMKSRPKYTLSAIKKID